jgi:hypothetical protein
MKIRGLALNYQYCEEMKKGVDLWHIDAEDCAATDDHVKFPFTNAWEAIQHLAGYFYYVWDSERVLEGKECCVEWRPRKNKDAFTAAVLQESPLDPEDLLESCPVCRSALARRTYQHEWLENWLVEDYDTSPGYGGADFQDHGPWDRYGAWASLVENPKEWFVIEENAEKVLALAVPEEMIPEKDREHQREELEYNLSYFDPAIRTAYEEWKAK